MKHLNPRQGITTRRTRASRPARRGTRRVKHLNPRQGITTCELAGVVAWQKRSRVKHLNPRQGITTE